MRVLIADDSEVIVERLAAMLAEMGGIDLVGCVGTAMDVSRAVRDLTPDVVILDIAMPGGSGIDVLEKLRKERMRAVVIVLTNHAYPQCRQRCLKGGAKFFLDKSTEFGRVPEVLRGLMGVDGVQE